MRRRPWCRWCGGDGVGWVNDNLNDVENLVVKRGLMSYVLNFLPYTRYSAAGRGQDGDRKTRVLPQLARSPITTHRYCHHKCQK